MFSTLNILRPILAILIMFIPLYPKFPLLNFRGIYVALRLDDIVVGLSILVFLIYQIKTRFPILKEKVIWLFAAYFIAITISALTSIFIYQTDSVSVTLLHTFRRLEYMSLFFLTVSALKTKKDFWIYLVFLLVSLIVVDIYGYGQKYFHLPVISTMNAEFSKGQLLEMNVWTRISSTFAGHYDLAAYLSVILVLTFCFSLLSSSRFLKTSGLIISLISFNVLTLTASRVSVFAFWGGIVLTLILIRKYLWIIPISVIVIFSITSQKDLNQRLLATIPAFKTHFNFFPSQSTVTPTPTPTPTPKIIAVITPGKTTGPKTSSSPAAPTPTIFRHQPEVFPSIDADAGVARSGEIRFNVEWPRALAAFSKNPLVGSGLSSITLATDNDYLRILGESGLLGFLTFSAIILFFILKTPFFSANYLSLTFFGGLITMLANATFIDVFEASKVAYTFWIMMGFYYLSLKK